MEFDNNSKITIGIVAFIAFGLFIILILPVSDQQSTIIIRKTVNGTGGGGGNDTTTCGNLGTGFLICAGGNVQLKSLINGVGISLASNGTNIQINNSLPENTTCNNVGTGNQLCSGGNINMDTLIAGTGITITDTTDDYTIASTVIDTNSCTNTGTGEAICESSNNINSLIAGNGISITDTTGDLTISNTGLTNELFTRRDMSMLPHLDATDGWDNTIVTSGNIVQFSGSIATGTGTTIGGGLALNYDWSNAGGTNLGFTRNKHYEIHIPIWLSSVTGIDLEIGLSDKITTAYCGNNDDCNVFQFNTATSANWYTRTNDNGAVAPSAIDTGVPVAIGWTILSIVSDETDVKFYINGVLEHTATTDLPTTTTQIQPRAFILTKTAVNKALYLFKVNGLMDAN